MKKAINQYRIISNNWRKIIKVFKEKLKKLTEKINQKGKKKSWLTYINIV